MSIVSVDGIAKVIDVDSAIEDVRTLYSAFADRHLLNLSWEPAFSTIADLPTVPVYATLINGWKIRHADVNVAYDKIYQGGFIRSLDGQPFITNGGVEPRVIYENPVSAVGYSTNSASGQTILIQSILDILESDEKIRGTTYEKLHKISKIPLVSKDVIKNGGDIDLIEKQ